MTKSTTKSSTKSKTKKRVGDKYPVPFPEEQRRDNTFFPEGIANYEKEKIDSYYLRNFNFTIPKKKKGGTKRHGSSHGSDGDNWSHLFSPVALKNKLPPRIPILSQEEYDEREMAALINRLQDKTIQHIRMDDIFNEYNLDFLKKYANTIIGSSKLTKKRSSQVKKELKSHIFMRMEEDFIEKINNVITVAKNSKEKMEGLVELFLSYDNKFLEYEK